MEGNNRVYRHLLTHAALTYVTLLIELHYFLTYDLFYVATACEDDTRKSSVTYAIGGCVTRDTCYLCGSYISTIRANCGRIDRQC